MVTQEDHARYGDNDSEEISKEIMSREKRYSEDDVTRIMKTQAQQFTWFGKELENLLWRNHDKTQKHDTSN